MPIINLYGAEADRAARQDYLKRQSINQAISGIGDIANTIFQYAQRKEAIKLKRQLLADSQDLREHNALTLALGTFGSKALGQPGLARLEKSYQKTTGSPELRFPRNAETGEIEIPQDFEKQLGSLLIDEKGDLSETGRAMWAATQHKPNEIEKDLDDYKHILQTYGPGSSEEQYALSRLNKKAAASMDELKANAFNTLKPEQQREYLLKSGGTSVTVQLPSTERKDLINTESRLRELGNNREGLRSFVKQYGNIFGRFNLKGKAFGLKDWLQVGDPNAREAYSTLTTNISAGDAQYRNDIFGAALSAADLKLAQSFIIDLNKDDLPKILGKIAGQEKMYRTKLGVQKEAARSASKGVPQFDKRGITVDLNDPDVADALNALE